MRYRLVIFDFDGTLADSAGWFLGQLGAVTERFGLARLSPEEIETLRGRSSREVVRRLRVPAWRLPAIAIHMRALAKAGAADIALFPGIDAVLTRLHANGVRIAVASSNGEDTVRQVLGPCLSDLIDPFECGTAMFGKAARIRGILKRCGVPAEAAILIGDETRDVEAARAAGVASGAVLWGYARPAAFEESPPTVCFATVEELAGFLAE